MNPDSDPRPTREANLATDTSGALDRALQQALQRIRAESLLALQDSAEELTRALDAPLAEPLSLNEITSGLDRLEGPALPSFSELESLLAAPEVIGLTLERNLLAELIRDGVDAQSILKKGLIFLKHRRYPEALEWWTLQRQALDPASSRLALLLFIMETLTHIWSGHPERAVAVRNQVKAHPLYRQLRPQSPRG